MNVLNPNVDFNTFNATTLAQSATRIRHQCRAMAVENDFVRRFIALYLQNTLGESGFTYQSRAKQTNGQLDKVANDLIEVGIKDWMQSKVDYLQSFYYFLESCMRAYITDGEALVYHIPSGNDYRVQLINPDALDDNFYAKNGDNLIIGGIEVDGRGLPQYYYFLTKDRTDPRVILFPDKKHRVRIPANQITHIFKREFIGQTRGISILHAPSKTLGMLREFHIASLQHAKNGADLHGFLKQVGEGGFLPENNASDVIREDKIERKLESGTYVSLPLNVEPVSVNPSHPNSASPSFIADALRSASSALGVAMPLLSNDWERVNYSSARLAVQSDQEGWRREQRFWTDGILITTAHHWLNIYLPQIGLPRAKFKKFAEHQWIPRAFGYVNPKDDALAIKMFLEMGLTTPSKELLRQGIDPDSHFADLEKDIERYRKLGISFPQATNIVHEEVKKAEERKLG